MAVTVLIERANGQTVEQVLTQGRALKLQPGDTLVIPESIPTEQLSVFEDLVVVSADDGINYIIERAANTAVWQGGAPLAATALVPVADAAAFAVPEGAATAAGSGFSFAGFAASPWVWGTGLGLFGAAGLSSGGARTPANQAPRIISNGGGDSAAVSVAENSVQVTQVSALTYSIAGGADVARFTGAGATDADFFAAGDIL